MWGVAGCDRHDVYTALCSKTSGPAHTPEFRFSTFDFRMGLPVGIIIPLVLAFMLVTSGFQLPRSIRWLRRMVNILLRFFAIRNR